MFFGEKSRIWIDLDGYRYVRCDKGNDNQKYFQKKYFKRLSSFNEILLNKPFLAPSTWVFRSELSAYVLKIYNSDKTMLMVAFRLFWK